MTGKTWIDHEGRLRLEHDENFQMVSPFEVDSIWHLIDSWDIDQACRLILLGYNEDIERAISYGFEHCPEGSTGRDRAHALITIANRFMTLAKSSVQAGTIKEHDTPANWIEWAKGKGYSVAHLMPADAHAAKGETQKRQRQDALAVELDEILVLTKSRTPAKVMAKLREQIGKPNTCITANVGDGLTWENDRGEVKTLTITKLGERIREWKKTGLSKG